MLTKFFHFINDNMGDRLCAPYHYFDFPGELEHHNIRPRTPQGPCDVTIFGGGAIAGTMINTGIHKTLQSRFKVAWGVGRTKWGEKRRLEKPTGLRDLDLIGVRDYARRMPADERYVPCVSCMHPLFDRPYTATREVVLFVNSDRAITNRAPHRVRGIPCLTNRSPIDDIIPWLASAETVLTNSYHGLYWATLLGRKVVLVNPYSSKFFNMRHSAPVVDDGNWREGAAKATTHPDFLPECRAINRDFHRRVLDRCYG
jgi:hypothetical protein